MDEKTVAALLKTKQEMGVDFLQNEQRVRAFLSDFLPAQPGERRYGERQVLVRLLEAGAPQLLAAQAAPSDAEFAALARRWSAALFMDENITHQALRIWHFAAHAAQGAAIDMHAILGAGGGAATFSPGDSPAPQAPAGTSRARARASARAPTKVPTAPSALETWANSIGMEFVKIPAGSYMRGSNDGNDDEKPQRRISISSFWMGKYPVTQEQWEAVMGSNPSRFKGRTNPVEMVNWHYAQEFVRRLNAKEGHNRYRLPTEAEWEYAARAGSTAAWCFGDDEGELDAYAWYGGNSGNKTHPVGQKKPNAWGLHDMHGNVWEWVRDWYSESYYASSKADNPRGPRAGEYRVLRGGSWCRIASYCRSARRDSGTPGYRDVGNGFRLVLSPRH